MDSQPIVMATRVMEAQFAVYRSLLAEMTATLDGLQSTREAGDLGISGFKDGCFCIELALTFYEEANLAIQAGAWFAATPSHRQLWSHCCSANVFFTKRKLGHFPNLSD